jgi:Bacterial aa3 type cytochrome c oxidase subunit IV
MQMEAKLAHNQDLGPAKETYSGFISLFKWGALAVAIVAALVVFIIASRAA